MTMLTIYFDTSFYINLETTIEKRGVSTAFDAVVFR